MNRRNLAHVQPRTLRPFEHNQTAENLRLFKSIDAQKKRVDLSPPRTYKLIDHSKHSSPKPVRIAKDQAAEFSQSALRLEKQISSHSKRLNQDSKRGVSYPLPFSNNSSNQYDLELYQQNSSFNPGKLSPRPRDQQSSTPNVSGMRMQTSQDMKFSVNNSSLGYGFTNHTTGYNTSIRSPFTQQKLKDIAKENQRVSNKLRDVKTNYSFRKTEESHQTHQQWKKRLSQFSEGNGRELEKCMKKTFPGLGHDVFFGNKHEFKAGKGIKEVKPNLKEQKKIFEHLHNTNLKNDRKAEKYLGQDLFSALDSKNSEKKTGSMFGKRNVSIDPRQYFRNQKNQSPNNSNNRSPMDSLSFFYSTLDQLRSPAPAAGRPLAINSNSTMNTNNSPRGGIRNNFKQGMRSELNQESPGALTQLFSFDGQDSPTSSQANLAQDWPFDRTNYFKQNDWIDHSTKTLCQIILKIFYTKATPPKKCLRIEILQKSHKIPLFINLSPSFTRKVMEAHNNDLQVVARNVRIVNKNQIKVHLEEDDQFLSEINVASIKGNYPNASSTCASQRINDLDLPDVILPQNVNSKFDSTYENATSNENNDEFYVGEQNLMLINERIDSSQLKKQSPIVYQNQNPDLESKPGHSAKEKIRPYRMTPSSDWHNQTETSRTHTTEQNVRIGSNQIKDRSKVKKPIPHQQLTAVDSHNQDNSDSLFPSNAPTPVVNHHSDFNVMKVKKPKKEGSKPQREYQGIEIDEIRRGETKTGETLEEGMVEMTVQLTPQSLKKFLELSQQKQL